MANELVVVDLLGNKGDIVQYTCAAGTAIAKGELMELEDLRTCKKASGAGVVIAGIAAAAKSATDTKTTIPVWTNGIFKCTTKAGGSATLGSYVRSAAADNTVHVCTSLDDETGKAVGKALETGGASEDILIRVLL